MARGRSLYVLLAACLLANALTAPVDDRWRRADNEVDSKEEGHTKSVSTTTYTSRTTTEKFNDDDDDEDFSDSTTAAPSGGSDIFSLLRLAGALLPSLSSSNGQSSSAGASSPLWTLKMDILRAVLQFGTSVLGLASSSSSAAATTP